MNNHCEVHKHLTNLPVPEHTEKRTTSSLYSTEDSKVTFCVRKILGFCPPIINVMPAKYMRNSPSNTIYKHMI